MDRLRPPTRVLDMTPDGDFRDATPPPPSGIDRAIAKVGGVAILVAVVAAGLLLASLAALALSLLLPIALGAGLIAAASIWWRIRRARARGEVPPNIRFVYRR